MSRLVTVVGATGVQGGSVIKSLLGNPAYRLRGVTRNVSSEKAKAISDQGVEMVAGDLDDIASLKAAFADSYAIFAVTNFFEPFFTNGDVTAAMKIETTHGINMATAAAATPTLKHYIWSTLPNSNTASRGKVTVPYYQAKAEVDKFIASQPNLLSLTTFLWVAFYASNFNYPFFAPFTLPQAADPTKLYQVQAVPASTPIPLAGDQATNVGLFVAATLAQPEKTLPGKTVLVSTESMTSEELLAAWANLQGKKSEVLVLQPEAYKGIWPGAADLMHISATYWQVMEGKAFANEWAGGVLDREALGVKGLIGTVDAFKAMQASA